MADVIREFLISLTYKIDSASKTKFDRAIDDSTNKFAGMGKAAALAGTAVLAAMIKISATMDTLYFTSERTKSSAENLTAFGYAAGQSGASAEAAGQSIERLASNLRRLPNMRQLMQNMGVKLSGDPVQDLVGVQRALSNKPMWVQLQYADLLGIEERVWLGLEKMGKFMDQRNKDARAMGVDYKEATRNANDLWTSLRRIWDITQIMGVSVQNNLFKKIGVDAEGFANIIVKNSKVIVDSVTMMFTALLAASALFSLRFMASPFGLVLAGIAAIMLLYEDYSSQQKGAEGLVDWGGIGKAIGVDNYLGGQKGETPEDKEGPPPGTLPRAQQLDNAAQIAKILRGKGWTEAQIAGALANANAESTFNPAAEGDKDETTGKYQSYGLFQWRGPRQGLYEKWAKANDRHELRGSSVDDQTNFMDWEYKSGNYNFWNRFSTAGVKNDPGMAGHWMSKDYEIPSDFLGTKASARGMDAQNWFKMLGELQNRPTGGGGVNVTNTFNINTPDPVQAGAEVAARMEMINRGLIKDGKAHSQ